VALSVGWTFVPLSSQHLVSTSDSIVVGTILSSENSETSGIWTEYQLNVTRWIKTGPLDPRNSVVTLSLPGGYDSSSGLSLHIDGTPELYDDDNGIFFIKQVNHINGTIRYQFHEFGQGHFRVLHSNGTSIAYRPYELRGNESVATVRQANSFINWISNTAAGIDESESSSLINVRMESILDDAISHKRFTTMNDGANVVRWSNFDNGGSVQWLRSASTQSGVTGGGLTELSQSFDAWNGNPNTPINYVLTGTTTSTNGLSKSDGINSVLFNDPANYIASSFNCNSGGTLATGGYWYGGSFATFRGIKFRVIIEGDLVIQDGISCYVNSNSNPSATLSNIITHELGHTLGLGHSCGDSNSGTCVSGSIQDLAVMRAYAHPNGGYTLGADDNSGIEYLYSTCYPNCPSSSVASPTPKPASIPTPAPTPIPIPAPSSTTSSSGTCSLGYQKCVGQSQYQTCTNGRSGNMWAAPQSCSSGLKCSPSGNNVYCIR